MQNSAGTENLNNQYTVLSVTFGVLHFVSDSLTPDTIDKNCLAGAKVLKQVDKKFIPIGEHNTWYNWSVLFFPLHNRPILVSYEISYNAFTLNDCFS